jgi:glycosyltransferase involved in cell wall biosynthesis
VSPASKTQAAPRSAARLAVFCDFSYRVDAGVVTAQLPFSLFLLALSRHFAALTLIGRLDLSGTRFPYEMRGVDLEPLPYYASGADLGAVMRALPVAMCRFWRVLARVDVVWVLGPNPPQAIAFALLALIRRRRVVLGVRQQLPQLIRHRHPGRPHVWAAAWILEQLFRLIGRRVDVVVVGPELERLYGHSRDVHMALVSLLEDSDISSPAEDHRRYDGPELRLLSVGRLDPEKNPLLMLEVLREAVATDPRWRLEVCGDGSLLGEMSRRAAELGLSDRVVLHGHLAFGAELWELYRACHALLHVSMTEGMPQVLLEAFAARLPVVATAVGGVPEMVRGNGQLIPPQNAPAAAAALQRLLDDPELRARNVESAADYVREHTLEAESARLAAFLGGAR